MKIIIHPKKIGHHYPTTHITYLLEQINELLLCRIPLIMHSIPGAPITNFKVLDELGEVTYQTKKLDEYPYQYIGVYPDRKIEGTLQIDYDVSPRVLDDSSKCGPYLDFREEKGGINAGGESFLLKFEKIEGIIELEWVEIIGVCGYGKGNLTRIGNINDFRDTYYAFGKLNSYDQEDFHFYYFQKPPFDVIEMAKYTASLYLMMKDFFQDQDEQYGVFLRKDPFSHSGGSALKRSYMLGYNDTEVVTLKNQKNILAHELVHNYPHILDDPYGIGTWYEEGIAEYYSVMLPLRNHLITLEEALYEIQRRADQYYLNPLNHLDNLTVGKTCWEDTKRIQTIPYGRGFFFLANLDVKIREISQGKMNLDTIVLAFIQKERNHEAIDNESFLTLLKDMTTLDIKDEFDAMAKGELFYPLQDSFDALFQYTLVEKDDTKQFIWSLRN